MYSSAAPKSTEHRNLVKKGRNVVHKTQGELQSESNSEHNVIGLVTCYAALELILENGKTRQCQLCDVLYVPQLSYNLLSVSKATEAGKRVEFHPLDCQIVNQEGKIVAVGVRKGNLYYNYLSC